MLRLCIIALLVAAATCCISDLGSLIGSGTDSAEDTTSRVCKRALAPTDAEQEQEDAATTTCIAEQDGLQAIIDTLDDCGSDEDTTSEEDTRDHSGGDSCGCDVATQLETAGNTDEAFALRMCIAREGDMLNDDDSYNMDDLMANIRDKVDGISDIESNVELGLDECPVVDEYDVLEYMDCIRSYCSTGAAPA